MWIAFAEEVQPSLKVFQVFLKVCKGKFISTFIFAVVFRVFLNSIVCEVNHFVFEVFKSELFGSSAYISFFIPIST